LDDAYWHEQAVGFEPYTTDLGAALAKAKGLNKRPSI
jgi:hypothetical protein